MAGAADYLKLEDGALLAQCEVHRARGTGPGGQKRNKTETAIRLRHLPTQLTAQSDETRSQHQNRTIALRRLRRRIALELRTALEPASYRPSPALLELVRLRGKLPGRRDGAHLPALAELLDLFVMMGCSVRDSAARLGISSGAMSSLLLLEEDLAVRVNLLRAERELRPLR